jgi:predicted alpha/beta hydrolase family esterase
MKIILLGGNSKGNIEWLKQLESELGKYYNDIFSHYYNHWKTNESPIDLDQELENLQKELKNIENYVIIAKSAGTLLTLKGIYEHKLNPTLCVFIGTPILWAQENNFDVNSWLKDYSLLTLFIHQANDPAISSNEFEALLKELNCKNYNLYVIPGDDHEYSDFQIIVEAINSFFKEAHI